MSWLLETLRGGATYFVDVIVRRVSATSFVAAIAFFALVCLVDWFTGRRIFSWTRRMARSAGASVGIHLLNYVVFPALILWSADFEKLYEALHIPHVPPSTWAGLPLWLVAIVATVAYDFANYWNHRAMHSRWIWPIHAIHHSDPEVTPLTTLRVHVLEALFMRASYFVLLTWMGLPAAAIAAGLLLRVLHNQYVHINVDWNHGPLELFLASPRYHRWHHADHPAAHGKNLANLFPIFDVVFGTYYNPHPCRERVGAEGVPENDVVRLLLFPFTAWAAMIGERARRVKPD